MKRCMYEKCRRKAVDLAEEAGTGRSIWLCWYHRIAFYEVQVGDLKGLLGDAEAKLREYELEHVCLNCGRQEPCELDKREASPDPENWPGSPCTFEPTPRQLYDRLREVEAERNRLTLRQLQDELLPWQEHNFPGREPWEPLIGAVEELGELSHAFLKRHQGIRTNEDHDAAEIDAVADIIVYLADFSNARGIDMQSALEQTWAKVKQRDWKSDSATAALARTEEDRDD